MRPRNFAVAALAVAAAAATLGFVVRSKPESTPAPRLVAFPLSPSVVQLSWSTAGRRGTFRVIRDGSVIAETARESFTDRGLRGGSSHRYEIEKGDAQGSQSRLAAATAATPTTRIAPAFPLKIGPTGRYLVDQKNVPFLVIGDSPQALTMGVSVPDAEKYLADRKAAGYNALWVNLLCIVCTRYESRTDGATFDGVPPFSAPRDLSTPNERYFARVDRVVALAQKYGFLLFLDPIETAGWLDVLRANGVEKSGAYGRYLGRRYGRYPNIVWFNGNDFQTWRTRSDTALVQAVARGIAETAPRQLQTVELNYYVSSSLDDPTWRPLIAIDSVYTYRPTYAELLEEYDRPRFMPTVMVEANYEFEGWLYPVDLATLRRQEYWTMLSGAAGQFYGNKYTWQFLDGWQGKLDTPGSIQMMYGARLFSGLPWYRLVPDRTHRIVAKGFGTYSARGSVNDNSFITAARTPDGKLAVAYFPEARPATIDLRALSGPVVARWFDPTRGTFVEVSGSPFPNRGAREFSPPGKNGGGQTDWVLLLRVGGSKGRA
ncbi:MAG: DUF4038 domain-containing protein [Gemmatimonadaceae bacterium]